MVIMAVPIITLIVLAIYTIQIYNGSPAPVSLGDQLSPQLKSMIPVNMVNLLYWGEFAAVIAILCFPMGYLGSKIYKD